MFVLKRKAAGGHTGAQGLPFAAERLLVYRAAFAAHQNKRAVVRCVFVAMRAAIVLRMAAQHIAVYRRHFVQHALLRPKIERTIGSGRRYHTLALLLHLREHILGFDHAAGPGKHNIQHLLAQSRHLSAVLAGLAEDLLLDGLHTLLSDGLQSQCYIITRFGRFVRAGATSGKANPQKQTQHAYRICTTGAHALFRSTIRPSERFMFQTALVFIAKKSTLSD